MTEVVAVTDRLQSMRRLDGRLVHAGRFVDLTFLLEVGEEPHLVTVVCGRVTAVTRGPHIMPMEICLAGER